VTRVAGEAEGAAVVIDAGGGWTAIVGGLVDVEVAEGQRVAAGQPIGAAGPAPVTFEVWRGRYPVDPLYFVQGLARPLAAPPAVP
jgi:septal ring factor EnvC (AmiA/AmiB activator)